MKRQTSATLTDLEGAALGFIASAGAVTSYAVAREFAASPSEFWSGSAGAIYPLMRRLVARKLVTGEVGAQGRRRATWYSITPTGRAEFKRWLLDADRAAGLGFDPLRTRLDFIALMTGAERQRFLNDVTQKIEMLGASELFKADARSLGILKPWLKTRRNWLRKLSARPSRGRG